MNAVLVRLSDAAFAPLGVLPPLAGLLVVSLATGAVMLLVVARSSNQPRMAATKRAMHAGLFEIRLFNDDPRAVLRSLGDLLRENARYLGLSLVPLFWMAVPLALAVTQLQAYYGYEGLTPGAAVLVKANLRDALKEVSSTHQPPVLEAPPSIRVDTPAIQLAGSTEVLWRIVPTAEGAFTLTILDGERSATKTLLVSVSPDPVRRSPVRVSPGLLDQFLYPSERPLPADSPVSRITVGYPEPGMRVFGWRVHWLIVFVVLSMGAAFGLARRFGVTL